MTRFSKQWIQHNQVMLYAVAVFLAIATGLGQPDVGSVLEPLINPVLAVLLYVTFLEIPFVRIRRAFRNGRFMLAALGMNFIVVPVVVFGLTRFLPQEPVILVGVFMVLLTPCIDYVITFTELAGGDSEQITAATPALMLIQLLLLPLFLWLFMGQQVAEFIEAGPFIEAFLVIIALPLTLAWATEYWADRSNRGEEWQDTMGWLPVPMMGVTLFVVIASQLPRVQDSIGQIAAIVPVYVVFFFDHHAASRSTHGWILWDECRGEPGTRVYLCDAKLTGCSSVGTRTSVRVRAGSCSCRDSDTRRTVGYGSSHADRPEQTCTRWR